MGCDIHMYGEYRMGKGDTWKLLPEHKLEIEEYGTPGEEDYERYEHIKEIGGSRSYSLFGLLSNVRCDGQMIEDRGFPENASPEVRAQKERDGIDGHSHNHVSLEDFKRVMEEHSKLVEKENEFYIKEFKEMHDRGIITEEQYERRLRMFSIREEKKPIYENPFKSYQWHNVVPYLEQFIKDNTVNVPEVNGLLDAIPEVRLVFWYDN